MSLSGLLEVLNPYGPELLLILRIGAVAGLAIHGYPKAKGGRVQAGQWMKSMGIPPLTADLVTVLEFLGGIFLVVGLLTPLVGLLFVTVRVESPDAKRSKMHAKFISTEQGKPTFEIDLLYLSAGPCLPLHGRRDLFAGPPNRALGKPCRTLEGHSARRPIEQQAASLVSQGPKIMYPLLAGCGFARPARPRRIRSPAWWVPRLRVPR